MATEPLNTTPFPDDNGNYTGENIKVLGGLEAVRLRPAIIRKPSVNTALCNRINFLDSLQIVPWGQEVRSLGASQPACVLMRLVWEYVGLNPIKQGTT